MRNQRAPTSNGSHDLIEEIVMSVRVSSQTFESKGSILNGGLSDHGRSERIDTMQWALELRRLKGVDQLRRGTLKPRWVGLEPSKQSSYGSYDYMLGDATTNMRRIHWGISVLVTILFIPNLYRSYEVSVGGNIIIWRIERSHAIYLLYMRPSDPKTPMCQQVLPSDGD